MEPNRYTITLELQADKMSHAVDVMEILQCDAGKIYPQIRDVDLLSVVKKESPDDD